MLLKMYNFIKLRDVYGFIVVGDKCHPPPTLGENLFMYFTGLGVFKTKI